jgi:esterase/lipase
MGDYEDKAYEWLKEIVGQSKTGEKLRNEAKVVMKEEILKRLTLSGVVVLLAAIAPDAIEQLMQQSIEVVSLKTKADVCEYASLDDEEFSAMLTEVRADIMSTVAKIQTFVERVK